jgi:5-methylcytosine-specific restriction endonuclease McrA
VAVASASATEGRLPELLRRQILSRDRHACAYCGRWANEVDHRVPASRGGLTIVANLTACCAECNRSKGARTFDEWQRGEVRKRALAASLATALRAERSSQSPSPLTVKTRPLRSVRRIGSRGRLSLGERHR